MVDTNQNGKFAHSLESEQATPQLISQGANDFSHLGEWRFLFACFLKYERF